MLKFVLKLNLDSERSIPSYQRIQQHSSLERITFLNNLRQNIGKIVHEEQKMVLESEKKDSSHESPLYLTVRLYARGRTLRSINLSISDLSRGPKVGVRPFFLGKMV